MRPPFHVKPGLVACVCGHSAPKVRLGSRQDLCSIKQTLSRTRCTMTTNIWGCPPHMSCGMHIPVSTCMHVHTHTQKHSHTHIYTNNYTHTYVHIHTLHSHTYIHTHSHIHTHTHTYINTHIHTYSHIHTLEIYTHASIQWGTSNHTLF